MQRSGTVRRALLLVVLLAACQRARPLTHEAYVWQRAWTAPVAGSVAAAAPELTALRVLALEIETDKQWVWVDVDVRALAASRRPITAVVRIDGARPVADLDLESLAARIAGWRAAGVAVVGLEIDHDCATAALPAYATWLGRARSVAVTAGLRLSITALPTWADSAALDGVATMVDEIVVQVHAVRAPRVFDAGDARRWLERFAGHRAGRPLVVALPTYTAWVGGAARGAEPAEVAGFLRGLERAPVEGVAGVVWFRLPVDGDATAWSAPTLRAVILGRPLSPAIGAALVARGPGVYDVVLHNQGSVDALWPALHIRGAQAADLVGGYRQEGERWVPPRRVVRPGDPIVIGWMTGKEPEIHVE